MSRPRASTSHFTVRVDGVGRRLQQRRAPSSAEAEASGVRGPLSLGTCLSDSSDLSACTPRGRLQRSGEGGEEGGGSLEATRCQYVTLSLTNRIEQEMNSPDLFGMKSRGHQFTASPVVPPRSVFYFKDL